MSVDSFDEFLQILRGRPDWQAELQRVVLTDRLLSLPDTVAGLAEAQQRTEARLEELAEAQQRTEARLDALIGRVDALAEAQQRTEELLQGLIAQTSSLVDHGDQLVGDLIERRYRAKAHAYFAPIVRRIHVLTGDELDDLLETAMESGDITERDAMEVRWADAVIRGRHDGEERFLVLEASAGIALRDVRRAYERAGYLAMTGLRTLAVAAGETAHPHVEAEAQKLGVWLVTNGTVRRPPPEVAA